MTRLAIIALASLLVSVILCYSALVVAEAIAEATMPRTEITHYPLQQLEDSPL